MTDERAEEPSYFFQKVHCKQTIRPPPFVVVEKRSELFKSLSRNWVSA